MKANELRIGNDITMNRQIITVSFSTFLNVERFPERYEPIPLTEEWLLKFGFEKIVYGSDETGYGTDYKLKASKDVFMVYSDDFSLALYSDESVEHKDLGVLPTHNHTKHVHQLQNLYFALTGEELQIKRYD